MTGAVAGLRFSSKAARGIALCVGLLLAGLLFAASPPNAAAHDVCTAHPSDPDAYGSGAPNTVICLRYNHTALDVCDRHADGNKAYARRYAFGVLSPLYDDNGADPGCSNYNFNALSIESVNVCVQNEGCGTPLYRPY